MPPFLAVCEKAKKEVLFLEKISQDTKMRFFTHYVKLGNVKEAAINAGFNENEAAYEGMRILGRKSSQRIIAALLEKTKMPGLVKAGLERLAFGDVNDAVRLAFSDELPSDKELSAMNLFNVSEIKRVKGGGVEIKLFDRLKAFEKLWELESSADVKTSAESFFSAIKKGAEAVSFNGEGEPPDD
jgi:hypothetical protein